MGIPMSALKPDPVKEKYLKCGTSKLDKPQLIAINGTDKYVPDTKNQKRFVIGSLNPNLMEIQSHLKRNK